MRGRMGFVALLAAALALGGCSRHELVQAGVQPGAPPVQGVTFAVTVTNTTAVAKNISYRYGGDIITALGTVQPGQTMIFTVPNRGSDNLEILAADQAGTNETHHRIDMSAGSTVSVTLK